MKNNKWWLGLFGVGAWLLLESVINILSSLIFLAWPPAHIAVPSSAFVLGYVTGQSIWLLAGAAGVCYSAYRLLRSDEE